MKAYLHDNLMTGELNPFSMSIKKFMIDEKTTLQLMEEFEYDNGFYKDILKVKVIDGFYKGETGFILEDNVCVLPDPKNDITVFFKEKTYIEEYDLIIDKDIKCFIEKNFIVNGYEIFRLKINSAKYNYRIIDLSDKSSVHFIINKYSDINYNIRRGYRIIKVVDSETLLPLKGAAFMDNNSDESGIMYIDSNKNNGPYKIVMDGYTAGLIYPGAKENIFLCVLSPADQVRYYDDRSSVYEKDSVKIIIGSRNLSRDKKTSVKVFTVNDMSLLSIPEYSDMSVSITGGFYISDISSQGGILCEIKNAAAGSIVLHFDENSFKWIKSYASADINGKLITINIESGGYYIIVNKDKADDKKILNLNFNGIYSSRVFIKSRYGVYSGQFDIDGGINLNLKYGEYEFIYFNIAESYKVMHKYLNIDAGVNYADINSLKDQNDYIDENDKAFSALYEGEWKKEAIKHNENYVEKKDLNVLEFLGNMTIEGANRISFNTAVYKIKGYYEIIDGKRMRIYLISINLPVKTKYKDQIIKVDPSLFNSELVISAYYSLYAGMFQLSFDCIYFIRNKIYRQSEYDRAFIIMDSLPAGIDDFPQNENLSKFKIFFSH